MGQNPNKSGENGGRGDFLMKNRRFAEAITVYEAQLSAVPKDLSALLKLGICHLLNRSEKEFLRIFQAAQVQVAQTAELSRDVQMLWDRYKGLAARTVAGVLVVGSLAVTGCTASDSPPAVEAQSPSAVKKSADSAVKQQPPGNQENPLFTGHRYSGGVYLPLDKENPPLRVIPESIPVKPEEKAVGGDTSK